MNAHDSMAHYVTARAPHLAPRRTTTPTPTRPKPSPVRFTLAGLLAVALVGALIGLWLSPGRAYSADPVTDRPGGVHVKRIDPAPAGPRITVTLSNGRTAMLRPCRFDDSPRCYWQSDRRGNGRGDDFLVMGGRVFVLDLSWIHERNAR